MPALWVPPFVSVYRTAERIEIGGVIVPGAGLLLMPNYQSALNKAWGSLERSRAEVRAA